jgi:hypothetical protein
MAEDRIVRKIQALLDKANGTEFPAEREECLRLAEKFMIEHAIEEYEIDEARKARGEAPNSKPIVTEFLMKLMSDELRDSFNHLLYAVVVQTGGRMFFDQFLRIDGVAHWRYKMIGYESEIKYAEMLFLSLQLQLIGHMVPKADPYKTFAENIYILHESGFKWDKVIHEMNIAFVSMNGQTPDADGWKLLDSSKRDRDYMWRKYVKWCKAVGTEPRNEGRPDAFRASYADSFVWNVERRIREGRQKEASTALVLRSREDEVIRLYDELRPKLDPDAKPAKLSKTRVAKMRDMYDPAGAEAGRNAAEKADLSHPNSRVEAKDRGINA